MKPYRDEIEAIEQNGITRVAFGRMNDPAVIPLWFGEGDQTTAPLIREAAIEALRSGQTFYTHTRGRPELREALQAYLQRLYGVDVHPDRITVPGSAMLGITIAAQTALARGTHGLIVGPAWPNIEAVFQVTGARFSYLQQRRTPTGWALSAAEILDALEPATRAVFVNSPCNPTGWVMNADQQRLLVEGLRDRGVLLIADEVYHRTVYGASVAPSFLTVAEPDDPVVVVNSFSKAWAMTGWRLGWVVTPQRHGTLWTALSECYSTGGSVFAQLGAVAALEAGEAIVADLQRQYARGRALVDAALGPHPLFDHVSAEGAFYAFPTVRGEADGLRFVEGVLAEQDVGLAPGYAFGPGREAHFRLCFAVSPARLEEGLERIVRYAERHYG